MKYVAAVAILTFVLNGCAPSAPPHPLGPLGSVSAIDVWIHQQDGSSDIFKISEPGNVAAVVAFVDGRGENWQTPWYGIPVPSIEARFYDREKFIGHFGVGKNFFECQRNGSFYSRDASATEIQEFLKLIDVDDETFKQVTR